MRFTNIIAMKQETNQVDIYLSGPGKINLRK